MLHIRFMMTAILAFALGATLARGQAAEPITRAWLRGGPWSARIKIVAGNELTAIALVGGVLLLTQRFLGTRPISTWGIGRWIWSVSALFALLNLSSTMLVLLLTEYRRSGVCPAREIQIRMMHATCTHQFLDQFVWAVPALAFTRKIAGIVGNDELDVWEFSGRLFGVLIVVASLTVKMLQALFL